MSGTARATLTRQLSYAWALPEPLLRAAARLATTDEVLAARLAHRLDLPADVRAQLRADRRPGVRAAFCQRADLADAELSELLGAETRSVVLAEVAAAFPDQATTAVLWTRLLAKPTKALAVALLPGLARAYTGPSGHPEPPASVLAAALGALGAQPTLPRHAEHHLERIAAALAAGSNPAAAELVATNPGAPLQTRVQLSRSPHLSPAARVALLGQVWPNLYHGHRPQVAFTDRYRFLAGGLDVLEQVLGPGADEAVLAAARAAVAALGEDIVPWWRDGWAALVAAAQPSRHERDCAACRAGAAELAAPWPAPGFAPGPREPRTGPGREELPPPGGPTRPEADPDPQDGDPAPRSLEDLTDYELAAALSAGADPGVREQILALGYARHSTVVLAAALREAATPTAAALDMFAQRWFAPADEVLVAAVEARDPDPEFALSVAGRIGGKVVAAFGPGVFAAPGPDRAATGAHALARRVRDVAGGAELPGWEGWLRGRTADEDGQLSVFAAHPDTPEEALLALPWSVLRQELTGQGWERSWTAPARRRLDAAMIRACAAVLGDAEGAWVAYERLAEDFTGSGAELLAVASACAG